MDIRDGRTVKGVNFTDLRSVGDPVELGARYAAEGADELVYLDISATAEGRRTFTGLVSRIAARIDIPFTVGGGIASVDDAGRLLDAGADKITVNSAAVAERDSFDYLYRAEDMAAFAGRKYSGQRNHINKFRKEYPDAKFIPLTGADMPLIENFWADYEQEFQKTSFNAKRELAYAKALARLLPEGWLLGGGLLVDDRLVAMSLAENCGGTLIIHVEKALYSHQGAYPTLVQAFAAHFGGDCVYINREDDAGDQGLRTSKLQYLPVRLAGKLRFEVRCEADRLREIPTVTTPRLTLTPLEERDEAAYNALCLDDARNRWWGYDYRQDLKGELTEDYFLSVARQDFAARRAVNFAVRLDRQLIGEVVLYRFDWRGGAELGCRIDPAYAGHGYGAEAFAAAADWALFQLSLARIKAKCYKENAASYKMLSACMRPAGEDETFFYFEKTV